MTFDQLPNGRIFRFYDRQEALIALKAFPHRGESGALVLTPTSFGRRPGDLVSSFEVGQAFLELPGVRIVPTRDPAFITSGQGNFAEAGEIEHHQTGLFFVSRPQAGIPMRVELASGRIGLSSGERPIEIYSAWSLQDDGQKIHEHRPEAPKMINGRRRYRVGDLVRFRDQSRLRLSFGVATDEVGTVVGVEPHPPISGPTYRIAVQFPKAHVSLTWEFEFVLLKAALEPDEIEVLISPEMASQ